MNFPSYNDDQLFSLLDQEMQRQEEGVELIASENFTSPSVMKAVGSVLTNKYAEGLPGKRYYGGCEIVDQVEQLAIDRAKVLFGAEWANVQPHSGAQANAAVFLALLQPGDKILGFDLAHGGHLSHGSPVNFSGKYFDAHFYGVEKETGLIDFDKVYQQTLEVKPKLLICGASSYSRDWDYKKLREAADAVGAVLLADISHPSGIIARGLLNDPVKHCHIITTTTHKTLRGPRGGMIMVGKDQENPLGIKNRKGEVAKLTTLLDSGVFPGTQGGPLEHVIAGKAVAFAEAQTEQYLNYVKQVVKNARAFAASMIALDYTIISGGTDNHMFLIDLRNKDITGKAAEKALGEAGITVNKNMVPFDDKSPFVTSGIRIGTAAITTRGLKEEHMPHLAQWIDSALKMREDHSSLHSIHEEIKNLMRQYPIYAGEVVKS